MGPNSAGIGSPGYGGHMGQGSIGNQAWQDFYDYSTHRAYMGQEIGVHQPDWRGVNWDANMGGNVYGDKWSFNQLPGPAREGTGRTGATVQAPSGIPGILGWTPMGSRTLWAIRSPSPWSTCPSTTPWLTASSPRPAKTCGSSWAWDCTGDSEYESV